MLSLFPELLFLAPFSALALRLSIAVLLSLTAWGHVSRPRMLMRAWALGEVVLAAALLVGAWTQPAALIAAVWLFSSIFVRDMRLFSRSTIILAIVVCLSLAVTGPGAFAFDLPL